MPVIKFSHKYKKLGTSYLDNIVSTATLIEVVVVELSNLSKEFISYDTDDGRFQLPSAGFYMMLIFKKPGRLDSDTTDIFTTMRRYTFEKEKYYRENIGKVFDIKIME
jgi:hypothetical protein